MSLIISQKTNGSNGTVGCLNISVAGVNFILIAEPFLLKFYSIDAFNNEFKVVRCFEASYRILTLEKIKPYAQDCDWILLINEVDQLITICPRLSESHLLELVVIENFSIIDHLRVRKPIDDEDATVNFEMVKPLIEVDKQQRFIGLHICRGFVIILTFNPRKKHIFEMSSRTIIPAQVKRNHSVSTLEAFKIFETPFILPIGSAQVRYIKFIHSSLPEKDRTLLAVIQLDTNLHHIISWFCVEMDAPLFAQRIGKNYSLKDYPYFIQPVTDGLLVFSFHALSFFPSPKVSLRCKLKDVVISQNVASKIWLTKNSCLSGRAIEICSNTFLFCLQNGHCLLINLSITPLYYGQSRNTCSYSAAEYGHDDIIRINDWNIESLGRIPTAINFLSKSGDLILGISRSEDCFMFDPYDIIHSYRPVYQNKSYPIIFISFQNEKSIIIAKGDCTFSELRYEGRTLELENKTIKDVALIDSTTLGLLFVILTESYIAGEVTSTNETNIHDQLLICDSNLQQLSSYDFDESSNCCSILSLDKFCYTVDRNFETIHDSCIKLDRQMNSSFLTICNVIDELGLKKSEITIFTILENGGLKRQTSSWVNRDINSSLILNNQKCILLGPETILWLVISPCRNSNNHSDYTLKIKLRNGDVHNFPCSYITHLEKLSADGKEIFVADSFDGLYYLQFEATRDAVKRIIHLVPHIMITDFTKIGIDSIAVCDVFGNFYLFQFENGPRLSMIFQFNLVTCAIGVIDSKLKNSGETLESMLKNGTRLQLCTVGAIDGTVIEIFCCFEDSQIISGILQIQTDLNKKYYSTLDTRDNHLGTAKSLDAKFARSRYIRLPYNIDQPHIDNSVQSTIGPINVIDARYIKKKIQLYNPEEKFKFCKLWSLLDV